MESPPSPHSPSNSPVRWSDDDLLIIQSWVHEIKKLEKIYSFVYDKNKKRTLYFNIIQGCISSLITILAISNLSINQYDIVFKILTVVLNLFLTIMIIVFKKYQDKIKNHELASYKDDLSKFISDCETQINLSETYRDDVRSFVKIYNKLYLDLLHKKVSISISDEQLAKQYVKNRRNT